MVASVMMKPERMDTISPFSATRLPSSSVELRSSANKAAYLLDRWDSDDIARGEGFRWLYEEHYEELERRDPSFKRDTVYAQSKKFFNEPSESLGGRIAYNNEEAEHAFLAEQAAKQGMEFPSFQQAYKAAHARGMFEARRAYEQYQSDMANTVAPSPRLTAAMGAIGPTITDPIVLGSIAATLPFGISVLALRTAAFEAGVGGLSEIPIQYQRSQWYRELGLELTSEEMITNVLLAAGTAGVIGGGVSAIYKMAGGTSQQIMPSFNSGPQSDVDMVVALHGHVKGTVFSDGDGYAYYIDPGSSAFPTGNTVTWMDLDDVAVHTGSDEVITEWNQRLGFQYDIELDHAFPNPGPHRNYAVGYTQEERTFEMNPAMGQNLNKVPQQIDRFSYSLDSVRLQEIHQSELQDAVAKISRGEMPSPKEMKQLSIHLNLTDPVSRLNDVKRLLGEGKKIDTKSKSYRAVRLNILREAFFEKFRVQIGKANDAAPDGKAPKPTTTKPKGTRKQLEAAIARAENAALKARQAYEDTVTAEIAHNQRFAYLKRSIERGDEVDEAIVIKVNKEGEELFKKQQKAKAAWDKAEEAIAPHAKRLNKLEAYEAEMDSINAIKAGLDAQRALEQMAEGKLPKTTAVKGMVKEIDDAMKAAKEAAEQEELVADIDTSNMFQFERKGGVHQGAYDFAFRLDGSSEAKAVNDTLAEAQVAQFNELADDAVAEVILDESGKVSRVVTKAEAAEEIADWEKTLQAMNSCGIGG